ncbi:MAG: ISL3 family transposase [Planctomycetes bacterium]|nr:ISL3 family transposase [Planctomycetota bacterium]
MQNQMRELFRVALGLAEPWRISKVEFSAEQQQLDLWVDFPSGSRFACPECGHSECGAYDTSERTWRHLNFFQYKTLLHARQPRVECPDHGVKTVEVPWAKPGSGFTLLMEAFILVLVQSGMTAAQAARLIGEHDTRVWRVLQRYGEQARAEADFSKVTAVGVDETSRRRGHNYISVFMDLDKEHSRVLFATEGKDAQTVEAFKQDLEAHGGKVEQIDEACLDMSPAFISGLTEQFPKVHLTFDKFHLMQLLSCAVDQVRREEQPTHPELKGTRYVWLKNDWNRTQKQASIFNELRSSHLATVRATHLKSVFGDLFALDTADEAEPLLKHWYFWATHSRIAPMIKVAKTIKKHWAGVLRWFTSRISNGLLEAINSLIQSAKAKARGFRSTRYLITMVYLIAGKLDFKLPAIAQVTHTK